MSSRLCDLHVDWATHEAVAFACLHWHYAKTLPVGQLVKVGAWEANKFIGCVIFSHSASAHLGDPYGLKLIECCELCRIALREHVVPVSRIVALALRFLCKQSPGLRLVVSFADPVQGHHGGIYQAGGWIYSGKSNPDFEFLDAQGNRLNKRAYNQVQFGTNPKAVLPPGAVKVATPGKHRYLMPLDAAMRSKIAALAQPYPPSARKQQAAGAPGSGRRDSDPCAPPIAAAATTS